mmetsp:Transcript_20068/g.49292  ORF Transcript_20068/g.49292 Transcript_20068/m.49292 type:complete len:478 (+) Transcript_20068:98-1531(+)
MCEPEMKLQDDMRVWGSESFSNLDLTTTLDEAIPAEKKPVNRAPRRRTLLKKQQSAPDLSVPSSSMWGIVQAVQRMNDDDTSVYSEKIEKYEVPEFKIAIPLTPHTEPKKKLGLSAPLTTGARVPERLPKMNQVPAIFDILVSPKTTTERYTHKVSQAEKQRIREILSPPMDDDEISAITSSIRSSRKTTRSSSKKKKSSRKLKKSNSLPSLLVGDEDLVEEEEEDGKEFKRSCSDRTLCTKKKAEKKLKKSSSDRSLGSKKSSRSRSASRRSSRRSSSKGKLLKKSSSETSLAGKKKKSSRKGLKKSNSSPSLVNDEKKLKKSSSERSLSKGAPRKRRTRKPRSKSASTMDLDPAFHEEALALKAEFEDRLQTEKLKLAAESNNVVQVVNLHHSPPQRKSGKHEEERIRVFAEAMRRSQSLSPTKYNLGSVDGYRCVITNDRRFKKSWSKVQPTPPKLERRWSGEGRGRPPAISVL